MCFILPEQLLRALNWLALYSKTAYLLSSVLELSSVQAPAMELRRKCLAK